MGVSDIPPCKPNDLLCNLARNAARAAVYNKWAQVNIVQVTCLFLFLFSFPPLPACAPFLVCPFTLCFVPFIGAVLPRPRPALAVPRVEPLLNIHQQRATRTAQKRNVRGAPRTAQRPRPRPLRAGPHGRPQGERLVRVVFAHGGGLQFGGAESRQGREGDRADARASAVPRRLDRIARAR